VLEDSVEDINSVAKVLQTKIKEAINKEKENVISMQEKTNEIIDKNKYEDSNAAPEDDADTKVASGKDDASLDTSMGEYDSNFKESSFDRMMKNILTEAFDEEDSEDDEDYSDLEIDEDESIEDDSEFDESLTDYNDDLLDDLDLDELDTELDKILLDEDAYDTSDLSEEDLEEIGTSEDEEDLEETARFVPDSKFDLIVDDRFKTKIKGEATLFESILMSLSPKFLNEAEGSKLNETKLLNEAVLSYTILEMFHTFKLVDFSNGKVGQLKQKITAAY
jgi:hypothetical protein